MSAPATLICCQRIEEATWQAVLRHRPLDAIERSSNEDRAVRLADVPVA